MEKGRETKVSESREYNADDERLRAGPKATDDLQLEASAAAARAVAEEPCERSGRTAAASRYRRGAD